MIFKEKIYIILICVLLVIILLGVVIINIKPDQAHMINQKSDYILLNEELKRNKKHFESELFKYVIISAENSYTKIIDFYVKNGGFIDKKDESGNTMLITALRSGYNTLAKHLIDLGADIDNYDNQPLLYEVLRCEDLDLFDIMIDRGANVNASTVDGEQAIHEASWRGWEDIAEILINKGADVNSRVDKGFYEGYTPLRFAVEYNRIDMIEFLIDNGADINEKDKHGKTLLHHNSEYGHIDVAKLLLEKGLDVNTTDDYGATPIFYTRIYGNKGLERYLKRKGGILLDKTKKEKFNDFKDLLNISSEYGQQKLIQELVKLGADINYINKYGFTPIHTATIYGQRDMVEFLIDEGAVIDMPDSEGKTALHHASLYGRKDIAELLIDAGSYVNNINNYGKTPLHYVVYYDKYELAELLLEKDADVNAVDNYGATPLIYSKIYKTKDISELLINNGGVLFMDGVSMREVNGKAPLHYACEKENIEMIKLLIDKGANTYVKTLSEGKLPIDIALDTGNKDIIELLKYHTIIDCVVINLNKLYNNIKTYFF